VQFHPPHNLPLGYHYGMYLRPRSSFAPLLIAATLLAWTPPATPIEPRLVAPDTPTPVILISIDTLRADHLSCYGYSHLATPHIDSLARGGTVFTEINAQVPITLPSHISLFTSTYPFANGVRENGQALPSGAVTLATVLAAHGYNTAAFIGGFSLARMYGLAQGFQTYDSPFDTRIVRSALDLKRPAAQVIDGAERWLQRNSRQPFLLFIHLFDLHEPYDPPATYRGRAPQSEYDQELAYVDDSLGDFFAFLARAGLDRRALIVLFSDHGESLGDHGENTHGYFIYQSTLHVPLIIHWPLADESRESKVETRNSGQRANFELRVATPAGLIDVAPTVLGFLGVPSPPSFCGYSLLELAKEESAPPRDVYSESFYAHDKFGWAGLRSLRRGDFQFIDAPHAELYDVKHDPEELHSLISSRAGMAASYREGLTALVARYASAPAASAARTATTPESAERLRALGYMEMSSPKPALDNSGVDPKDRLFEFKRYLLAGHLARTGKANEAAEEFQSILAGDPRNLPAMIELARVDGTLHRYFDGESRLKAALALDPQNVEAEELLGDTWLAMGDHARAEAEFRRLLTFAPHDYEAQFGLGLLTQSKHRYAEATEHFRAALAADPLSAEAHYQLGLILEAQSQRPQAVKEFQSALQIDPQYQPARRELAKITMNAH
jgi:arylsulfatase A-like enzyme/Flp pilus assembly protein TadD